MPSRKLVDEARADGYRRGTIDTVLRLVRARLWPSRTVEEVAAAAGVSHAQLVAALAELRRRAAAPPTPAAAHLTAVPDGGTGRRSVKPVGPPPDQSGDWKWCPKGGGHWERLAEFSKNTSRRDGLADYCRPHWNAYVTARKQHRSG